MGGIMASVASVILVLSAADTLRRLRTPDMRRDIEDALSEPPADSLGISVAQVVDLLRVLAYVSAVLAGVALVLAIFAMQRHHGARIGFTVLAGLLLAALPVAGLMPFFLVVAAFLLWSRPARAWFSGEPLPVEAPPAAQLQQPSQPPAEPWGPPASSPWGPPPAQPGQGDADQAPASGGAAVPPPATRPFGEAGPAQAPAPTPDGSVARPEGQPVPPAGWAGSWMPAYAAVPPRRPATVTAAAVITWVCSSVVAGAMGLFMGVLVAGGDSFVSEVQQQAAASDLIVSDEQVLAVGWALAAGSVLWCLVGSILAVFAFKGSNAGRIGLVVSASLTALFSLVAILSLVSVVTLFLGALVVMLLFMGGANEWYASKRAPASMVPPGYPRPQQGPQPGPQQPRPKRQRNQPW